MKLKLDGGPVDLELTLHLSVSAGKGDCKSDCDRPVTYTAPSCSVKCLGGREFAVEVIFPNDTFHLWVKWYQSVDSAGTGVMMKLANPLESDDGQYLLNVIPSSFGTQNLSATLPPGKDFGKAVAWVLPVNGSTFEHDPSAWVPICGSSSSSSSSSLSSSSSSNGGGSSSNG